MKHYEEVIITDHAKDRMISRSGLNKKSLARIATKAFNEGITHSQVKGRLKKFVDKLWFHGNSANNIRLYGDKAYLFRDNILITIIQIPNDLTKDMKKMIKHT